MGVCFHQKKGCENYARESGNEQMNEWGIKINLHMLQWKFTLIIVLYVKTSNFSIPFDSKFWTSL